MARWARYLLRSKFVSLGRQLTDEERNANIQQLLNARDGALDAANHLEELISIMREDQGQPETSKHFRTNH